MTSTGIFPETIKLGGGMRSGEDQMHAVDLDGSSLVFVRWFGRSFEASP